MKSEFKAITRNLSISLALVGGVALAPQVLANEGYSLSYKPAQVRSAADMQRLYARVLKVAENQCPTSRGVQTIRPTKACREEVAADLVHKIAVPGFSAFVEERSRGTISRQLAANDHVR